jgi:hypothetical protein
MALIKSGRTPLAGSRWTSGSWSTARSMAVTAARSAMDSMDRLKPLVNTAPPWPFCKRDPQFLFITYISFHLLESLHLGPFFYA